MLSQQYLSLDLGTLHFGHRKDQEFNIESSLEYCAHPFSGVSTTSQENTYLASLAHRTNKTIAFRKSEDFFLHSFVWKWIGPWHKCENTSFNAAFPGLSLSLWIGWKSEPIQSRFAHRMFLYVLKHCQSTSSYTRIRNWTSSRQPEFLVLPKRWVLKK